MLTLIQTAQASQAAAAQPNPVSGFLPIILIFAIFYFLIIRPQQKRIKQHQAKINSIKKGDTVVTSGGIYGKVIKVSEDILEVEVSKGVILQAVKSTISDVSDKKFTAVGKSEEASSKKAAPKKKVSKKK